MIRNIIFDIGQVLVDFRWQAYMRDLGFEDEVIETLGKKTVLAPIWGELDLGVRPEEDVYEDMYKLVPQYEAQLRRFLDEPKDLVRPFPDTRGWLSGLKHRGYRLFLLSNYPRSMFLLHERTRFDFMDLIDGKVVSGFEQVVKPQPGIYELLLSRYNLKPQECVFLDDRLANVEAARKMGIESIHVSGTQEEAIEDLNELLNPL